MDGCLLINVDVERAGEDCVELCDVTSVLFPNIAVPLAVS